MANLIFDKEFLMQHYEDTSLPFHREQVLTSYRNLVDYGEEKFRYDWNPYFLKQRYDEAYEALLDLKILARRIKLAKEPVFLDNNDMALLRI